MNISQKYLQVVDELTPYIFSYKENLSTFNLKNFAKKEFIHFDPFNEESLTFFNKLKVLDSSSFGESGMGMDNWVFLDCAIMPSAVIGFATHSSKANDEILKKYNCHKNDDIFIPLSMFIAIPMAKKDFWFAHNLSSSNSFLKTRYKGLGLLTKALGLNTFKIKNLMGATQWDNSSLYVHTKLAPLKIESVKTPIHSHPKSLIYSCEVTTKNIEDALMDRVIRKSNEKFDLSSKEYLELIDRKFENKKTIFITNLKEKKLEILIQESLNC